MAWNELQSNDIDCVVAKAYQKFLGRTPEPGVTSAIALRVAHGEPVSKVIAEIAFSDESDNYINRLKICHDSIVTQGIKNHLYVKLDWANVFRLSVPSFINFCYTSLLHRSPDAEGYQFYLNKIFPKEGKIGIFSRIYRSSEYSIIKSNIFSLEDINNVASQKKRTFFKLFLNQIQNTQYDKFRAFDNSSEDDNGVFIAGQINKIMSVGQSHYEMSDSDKSNIVNAIGFYNSVQRLSNFDTKPTPNIRKIAVIGPNPSDGTGISNFNSNLYYCDDNIEFHIFCPLRGDLLAGEINQYCAHVKYFDINSFSSSGVARRYNEIIVVLGNSDHNIESIKFLLCLPKQFLNKVYIEIHDPFAFNVVQKSLDAVGKDFYSIIRNSIISAGFENILNIRDHDQLVAIGVTGISALGISLQDIGGFIFHSQR